MTNITEEIRQALRDKPRLIDYTQRRDGIIGGFESLADYEWQMEHWVDSNYKHAFSDSIWYYCFDTLIQDYKIDELKEGYRQVGFTLYDKEEAEYLQPYCAYWFELVDVIIGSDEPDAAYYKHGQWPRIVHGAIMCHRYMAANNLKYDFWREFAEAEGFEYTPGGESYIRDQYFLDMDVAAYMHKHWPNWQVPK